MKPVLQHIFQLKRQYEQRPFFDHLRDERLTPRQRLAFLPCMAPFILAFGDLNRYVLRDEPTVDPYQAMVNAHSREDDHHWPWYLEDFSKLGHDSPQAPSDTLRFHYSDSTAVNRRLALRLAHLIWSATPVQRLVVIEAIEETGNVLFALTARLAAQYEAETGVELRYCGEFHFQLESGHAMKNDHAELARIELDEASRNWALVAVDEVFSEFADWTEELLRYSLALQDEPRAAPSQVLALHAGA